MAEPVPGPDAFAARGRDARLSQAAIVLSVGAAAAGEAERVDRPEALGLPAAVDALGRAAPVTPEEVAAPLDPAIARRLPEPDLRVPAATSVELMAEIAARPDPVVAAALVEVSLHSASRLVRTSAAVAALDTTGPREEVVALLVDGASHGDALTRDIGRIGLARVDPQHEVLARVTTSPSPRSGTDRPSHTAVLTHGTWAGLTRWWQPGGDFHTYLGGLTPPLHPHDPSFRWSGLYSDGARRLAAREMALWVEDQGLQRPDVFAHSHGGTVANLATWQGLEIDRLVLLSWPVHGEWFPDFTTVGRVVDVRVNLDLVIIADRGGQTLRPPAEFAGKVTSHVNGWFEHGDTHQPAYWQRHGLAGVL